MAVIHQACKDYVTDATREDGLIFNSHDPEDVIPVLIAQYKTCYQVAKRLSTPERKYYPASIRHWLETHGWKLYDGQTWDAPNGKETHEQRRT
jgi:hypothetical protein